MKTRFALSILIPALFATQHAFAQPATTQPTSDELLLSSRIWRDAGTMASNPQVALLAAELMDASIRLDPQNLVLLRSAIDLRLRLGDRDRSIELLTNYRKLDPADELTLIQSLDLMVDKMESAADREKYLSRLTDVESISEPVRGHAATLLVGILRDGHKDAEADAMLDKALKLNPLDLRALQLKYERTIATATPAQRTSSLIGMIKSNPNQPSVAAAIGNELARVGALPEAAVWYQRYTDMMQVQSVRPDPTDMENGAAVFLMAGNIQPAAGLSETVMRIDPMRSDAIMIRLLALRATQGKLADDVLSAPRAMMLTRLEIIRRAINKVPDTEKLQPVAPTSRPVIPDVRAEALKLIEQKSEFAGVYASWLADWAWMDVYFAETQTSPEVLDALTLLIGADSPAIARLRGWNALRAGEVDAARLKLSAAESVDPLAALGLIVMDMSAGVDKKIILDRSTKLLTQYPLGAKAATIHETVRALGDIKVATADKSEVLKIVAEVPEAWADFYKRCREFYVFDIDSPKIIYGYGEAIYCTVTLTNVSRQPITVGPGGAIESNIVIDAQLKGGAQDLMPAIAILNVTSKVILKPGETIKTTARVDTSQLGTATMQNPQMSLTAFLSAVTNPRRTETGFIPGPGGFRQQAKRPIERSSIQILNPAMRPPIYEKMMKGTDSERFQMIELVSSVAQAVLPQIADSAQARQFYIELDNALDRAIAGDQPTCIKAIALLRKAQRSAPAQRDDLLREMLRSKDWTVRYQAALALLNVEPAIRQPWLQSIASEDSDPSVRSISSLLLRVKTVSEKSTTQPASGPSTDAPGASAAPATAPSTTSATVPAPVTQP